MSEVIYQSRTHPKILFKPALIQVGLFLLHVLTVKFWPEQASDLKWKAIVHGVIVLLEIYYVVVPILKWWNNIYVVTNEKVKNDWGVVYKNSREIALTRISSISEERGLLDRVFRAGTLNFYDAAAVAQPKSAKWNAKDNVGVQFSDVPKVKEVRSIIEEAKRNARSL